VLKWIWSKVNFGIPPRHLIHTRTEVFYIWLFFCNKNLFVILSSSTLGPRLRPFWHISSYLFHILINYSVLEWIWPKVNFGIPPHVYTQGLMTEVFYIWMLFLQQKLIRNFVLVHIITYRFGVHWVWAHNLSMISRYVSGLIIPYQSIAMDYFTLW